MIRHVAWTLLASVSFVLHSAGIASAQVGPTPVPEPSSLALIAAGIGAVAWAKLRRRK